MSSPTGSIKTESSVPFDGFSPLNNDHEDGAIKSFSQQSPNEERASEIGGPASPSPTHSTTSVAPTLPSVKTEVQTPLAQVYRSGSPDADMVPPAQDQSIKEEAALGVAVVAVDAKVEDMEDSSRQGTPIPSHLNPGVCQDEDSQQSFNQESQSSEAAIFSVRWPKVCLDVFSSIIGSVSATIQCNTIL